MSFGKDLPSREPSIGPQERIAYKGELRRLLETTLTHYDIGEYVSYDIKQNGYEDFNLVLETTQETVFLKCFAEWRSEEDCHRYIDMIEAARVTGQVQTPFLYPNVDDNLITNAEIDEKTVQLCIMQYLDGGNIWESKQRLTTDEQIAIIHQAAKITQCAYQPPYVEDSWAIINAAATYTKNHDRIDPADREVIEGILAAFARVDITSLPHAFVHGDIRSTNVMRHSDGEVYVIDFSVANVYPRIVELAVLCCDLFFNPANPHEFPQKYPWILEEYTRAGVSLTPQELAALPLFIRLAHAMNVIGASSVSATNYISQVENDHWLQLGRKGLRLSV